MNQLKSKDRLTRNYYLYRWFILNKRHSCFLGFILNVASFIFPTVCVGFPFLLYFAFPSYKLFLIGWVLSFFGLFFWGNYILIPYGFTNRYAMVRLANDPRPPIIYIRSFLDDEIHKGSMEFTITSVAEMFGPMVTLGQPGEYLPPRGAARLLVAPEENWQETVKDFMLNAQLIIISPDFTPGIIWEILTAIKLHGPEKIIFTLLYFQQKGGDVYKRFRDTLLEESKKLNLPILLPEDIGSSSFLYFDLNWQPRLVGDTSESKGKRDADFIAKKALENFLLDKGAKRRPIAKSLNILEVLYVCYLCLLALTFFLPPLIYFLIFLFWLIDFRLIIIIISTRTQLA